MISRKFAPELAGIVDLVGYMKIVQPKDKPRQRMIFLQPTDQYMAGDRLYNRPYCSANGNVFLFNQKPQPKKQEVK